MQAVSLAYDWLGCQPYPPPWLPGRAPPWRAVSAAPLAAAPQAWEGYSVRSYPGCQPVTPQGGVFDLSNGAEVVSSLGMATETRPPPPPVGGGSPGSAAPVEGPENLRRWRKAFDTFVAGLPLVDHAVDASREDIY